MGCTVGMEDLVPQGPHSDPIDLFGDIDAHGPGIHRSNFPCVGVKCNRMNRRGVIVYLRRQPVLLNAHALRQQRRIGRRFPLRNVKDRTFRYGRKGTWIRNDRCLAIKGDRFQRIAKGEGVPLNQGRGSRYVDVG